MEVLVHSSEGRFAYLPRPQERANRVDFEMSRYVF